MTARGAVAVGAVLALLAAMTTAASAVSRGTGQVIGIPAYWSPETPGGMAEFRELSYATPAVEIVVINGPESAPPRPFSAATARAIRMLHREGATVLGYVDTGYLGRTGMTTTRVNPGSTDIAHWQAQIAADAAAWYELYGRYGLDGVFFDQTLSACGPAGASSHEFVDVYADLATRVQRHNGGALIAINPGTDVAECYTDVADVIVIFENTWEVYQTWTPPQWVFQHPATTFWHLVHAAPSVADMRAAIALSRQRNAGLVYVTSHEITPESSPWNGLPGRGYWVEQLRTVGGRGGDWANTA